MSNDGCSGIGSSPRVRGTHVADVFAGPRNRFIPACAGNTLSSRSHAPMRAVHPRVCGEHSLRRPDLARCGGSSPRVRGTPHRDLEGTFEVRFIPACAGNTNHKAVCVAVVEVHPRVCGEHVMKSVAMSSPDGSSPRVRGTHLSDPLPPLPRRFIPACAGNTAPPDQVVALPSVHPRVCGEHGRIDRRRWGAQGSSPRVRGTPSRIDNHIHPVRFIPACAGNTRSQRHRSALQPVHPRVCGEHTKSNPLILALDLQHSDSTEQPGPNRRVSGADQIFKERRSLMSRNLGAHPAEIQLVEGRHSRQAHADSCHTSRSGSRLRRCCLASK